ncbi:hypothetical protein M5X11_39405, partial [Paenibacillus alginolyticus]|uniref:hypothetical protein n=1 Tax=Paenibacillus alginolyticus TaxID=59839 RepID=UPI002284A82A
MEIKQNRFLKGIAVLLSVLLVISLMGCGQKTDAKTTGAKAVSEDVKRMPDEMTKVNLGLPSNKNMSYLPFFVALKSTFHNV